MKVLYNNLDIPDPMYESEKLDELWEMLLGPFELLADELLVFRCIGGVQFLADDVSSDHDLPSAMADICWVKKRPYSILYSPTSLKRSLPYAAN